MNEFYKIERVPLSFIYNGVNYSGEAWPIPSGSTKGQHKELDITLNHEHLGTIYSGNNTDWNLRGTTDQDFVDRIGEQIALWYQIF